MIHRPPITSFSRPARGPRLAALLAILTTFPTTAQPAPYRLHLDVLHKRYDGKTCWVHPRAGEIPGDAPTVALTMQMQTWGPDVVIKPDNKYGADNSVYAARIIWNKPNASWNQH